MKIVIGTVVVVVLLVLWVASATRGPTALQLLELANRQSVQLATQSEQQAVQNERMATLQQQWQAERHTMYQQRDELETDRKDLATQRADLARDLHREPVIAQSILQVGTLAMGLLPLAVCALLLRKSQDPAESEVLTETLIADLMSHEPTLLAHPLPAPEPTVDRLGSGDEDPNPRLEPPVP